MRKELIWTVLIVSLLVVIPVKAAPGPGLVGLWHFDNVTTPVSYPNPLYPKWTPDSSGLDNDGYLFPIEFEPTLVEGKFGNALSFDGINDYVAVRDSSSLDVDRVTIEAWVYLGDSFPSGHRNIVRKGHTSQRCYGLDIYPGTSPPRTIRGWVNLGPSGGSTALVAYGPSLATNTWYHVAMTYDGSNVRVYVDSVQVGMSSTTTGNIFDNDLSVRIGGQPSAESGGALAFKGKIDEVRIWNEALTAAQIQQSYALGTTSTMTEPRATVELGEQFLAGGGVAIFTSAFYWPSGATGYASPVILEARVLIVGSTATVTDSYIERKITPRGTVVFNVDYTPVWGLDVTVTSFDGGAKSLHLSMVLSTGEGLGFNIQNLPYD